MLIFGGSLQFSMSSDSNKTLDILPDGMHVRSEEIGFAAGELLSCPKCTRPNSPHRGNCIYCGETLLNPERSALKVEHGEILETWENGFNVVFRCGGDELPENAAPVVARLIGLDQPVFESVLQAKTF